MKKPSSKMVTTINNISPTPSASSKVSFRSRKIRKPTSDTPAKSLTKVSTATVVAAPATKSGGSSAKVPRPLTSEGEIEKALLHLRAKDPLLAPLIDAHPPPTLESSRPPFLALSRIIINQQLGGKAAEAIFNRVVTLLNGVDNLVPDAVLAISAEKLRELGVSQRKASYIHDLASKYTSGVLSDESIPKMDDDTMFEKLTSVKGIGAWSVHMFMIYVLHRADVLPVGDWGVRKGVQVLYGLKEMPGPAKMEEVCEKWRPYRSVGAWYMWRLMDAKGKLPTAAKEDSDSA